MKSTIQHFLFCTLLLCFTMPFTSTAAAMPLSQTTLLDDGGAYLIFAGKTGGSIAKKDLNGQLHLSLDGCPGAKESTITSFTLEITKGGKINTLQSSNNKLSSEMLTKLKSLSAGDAFEFKKVMAHFPKSKDLFEVHTQKFTVA